LRSAEGKGKGAYGRDLIEIRETVLGSSRDGLTCLQGPRNTLGTKQRWDAQL